MNNTSPLGIILLVIVVFVALFAFLQLLPLFGGLFIFLAPFLLLGLVGGWLYEGARQKQNQNHNNNGQ